MSFLITEVNPTRFLVPFRLRKYTQESVNLFPNRNMSSTDVSDFLATIMHINKQYERS